MVLWAHCEAARYDEMADQQTKTSCCKEDVWLSSLPIICSSLCSAFKRNGSFFPSFPHLLYSLDFFLCLSWQDYLCCEEINYRERAKHRIAWYVGSQPSDGP